MSAVSRERDGLEGSFPSRSPDTGRRRLFDHDEAYERWQAGEAFADLARAYGVGRTAVVQAIRRRVPDEHEKLKAYEREYQRDHLRKPCIRGCGRLAWHTQGRAGVCAECDRADRRAAALAQDNHGTETRYNYGCRCGLCRGAAAAARRRRRAATAKDLA